MWSIERRVDKSVIREIRKLRKQCREETKHYIFGNFNFEKKKKNTHIELKLSYYFQNSKIF